MAISKLLYNNNNNDNNKNNNHNFNHITAFSRPKIHIFYPKVIKKSMFTTNYSKLEVKSQFP